VVVLPHPIGPGMQQHRYTANREGLGIPLPKSVGD
jgi:hypothetical protein